MNPSSGIKLSLLVLSWNHASYIEQALGSAKEQSLENYEVIFLDNGSTDDTYAIGCKYLKEWGIPHQCYQNETPKGITANANFLFDKAGGEYVMYLSADDWYVPNTFQKRTDFLDSHPNVGMLYTGGTLYFDDTGTYQLVDTSNFKRGRIHRELLTETGAIFFVGCCFRVSVMKALGGWDEALLIEDIDLMVRMSDIADIDFIAEPMVYYRRFSKSASTNVDFMVKGWEQYYEKYKNKGWIDMEAWMAEKYRTHAAAALDQDNLPQARTLIEKSLRKKVFQKKMISTLKYYISKLLTSKQKG